MIVKGDLDSLHPATAERLVKHTQQLNQLFNLQNVMRLDKQNALVRRLVRKTQDGTLGQPTSGTEEDADVAEDEDDKVQFGDNIVNYTAPEPAQQVAAKLPSLLPYVLAAALGGGGLGAAAMAIPALLKKDPPPVVNVLPGDDTDTLYDLRFKED